MTRDTWVSSTCLERNVSLSHKQDTSFNIAELLTCLLKLRLHEFEIRKVISSTNNKKKNLLLWAWRAVSLRLLKDLHTKLYSQPCPFRHQFGSHFLHKRKTVTTILLLFSGCFWVNFPVFCIEKFSNTNDTHPCSSQVCGELMVCNEKCSPTVRLHWRSSQRELNW